MALDDNEPAPEAPDLKAEMGAIFDEANKSAPADETPATAASPSEPVDPPAVESQPAPSGERARGPDGKFLKAAEKAPDPKTPEAAPVAAAPVIDPAATTAAPTAASTVPKSWKSEHRDLFMKADPKLRDYIAQRETEMERGVAQLRERFAPIEQALAPVAQEISLRGLDPAGYIRAMVSADFALRQNGPEAIQMIARQYGIDLARLTQTPNAEQPPADPQIAALHQQINSLTQLVNSQHANQSQAVLQQTETLVDRFASDPANKYFKDVETAMLDLLPVMKRQMAGQSPEAVLKAAYDRAVYFDPDVRQKVLAEQAAEANRVREAEAKKKAAEAVRIAGTNLSSRASPAGSPSAAKSQKDTLAETYDRMQGAA